MSDLWTSVAAVPPLGEGDVHLWRDELTVPAPWAAGDLLSTEEQAQAARMTAATRQAVFVRGRSALRFLAGSYLGVAPDAVPVRLLALGKPVIDQPDGAPHLAVSVAHSGTALAYAFARAGEIGVDVEGEDRSVDRGAIARRFFSLSEAVAMADLPELEQVAAFFSLWVRKEALLKAVGKGLTVPLAEVELSLVRNAEPELRRLPKVFGKLSEWTVRGFAPRRGVAGAFAVRASVVSVQCLSWRD